MATIIDSLLVTLGLKADDFHKEKKKVQSGLDDLGKSAAKFLAIIGGTYEIKKFVQGQIEASAALARLSQNLNESAQAISTWGSATEVAGGKAGDLETTLKLLSRAQTDIQLTGQSGLIPYFSALGISLTDATTPLEKLVLLHNRFINMNRTTAYNMGQMMGIPEGELQLLLKNQTEFDAFMKNAKKYSVTKEQTDEALRLSTAMGWVTLSFESFGRTILEDVSPILETILQGFKDFGDWCHENKTFVEGFLTVMAVGIAAISVAALPITAATAAFVAFGLAIAAAWNDYQVWKQGGDSFFTGWGVAIDGAVSAFRVLRDILQDVLYRAANVGAALMAIRDGNWSIAKDAAKAAISGTPPQGLGNDRQNFINAAASQLGVPPAAIDAQLRLETGATGASTVGNYNYGNIKSGQGYAGNVKKKATAEYTSSGQAFTEISNFRSYSTAEEAAADYAAMIKRKFPGAVGAQTAAAFAGGLQAGGYATDPNYVNKVSKIANGIPNASAAAAPVAGLYGSNQGGKTVSITLGDVHVNAPQATDAAGIARDMDKSLKYLFTSQANYGLR